MAGLLAVHSVGSSLVRFLDTSFPGNFGGNDIECAFRLVSSGELTTAATQDITDTLTLFLYRITVDEHSRNASSNRSSLGLNLHFLMTVWSSRSLTEHVVLSWAMRQFHQNSVLDLSMLSEDGGWRPGDTVQLIPTELSNEDLWRIWDALEPPYRLSVAYTARVVRIDPDAPGLDFAPVVATRFSYQAPPPDGAL